MDANELISYVENTLGLDVYRYYTDSRRYIPEAIVTALAVACLTQFLQGLIDFKKMGEKSRRVLEDLINRWRVKDIPETSGNVRKLETALSDALELVPASLSEDKYQEALMALGETLHAFGLPTEQAKELAAKIAQSVAEFAASRETR